MEYKVLGPLAVEHAGTAVKLPGTLQRRLLTALLVQANTVVSVDRLIHILWGDDATTSASRNLQNQVWRVRAALDECGTGASAALATQQPGYLLRVSPDALDAARFERMVAEAGAEPTQPPEWVAERLAEALDLWRGPAFAEFTDEEFCRYEAMRLTELRLVATEQWFEARLAIGRQPELIGEIEAFAAEHPLRERPRALQMLALYRSGRQADAVAVYRKFREHLVNNLGLEPSAEIRLRHRQILAADPRLGPVETMRLAHSPVPVRPPANGTRERRDRDPADNLRLELSELVGRVEDIAAALDTLSQHRVVTMTGVGGVGKTRLALRVAAEAQSAFPDGVWVCELAAVRDGWLVPEVVATTLGAQEPKGRSVTDGLVDVLRSRHALLVIDNCEHVLDAAAHLVDALARGCRDVTILATSREPLGVDGEQVLPVRPLAVPGPGDHHDLDRIAEVPSIALFLHRAAAVLPSFTLNTNNVTAITEICRRLDGLPLAIELAATRLPFQSVSEIANLLERRLHFLQSTKRVREERHTTLGTVVDWSYNLLEPVERSVFDRLSVLVGTFTMDEAVAVAGDGETDATEIVQHVIGLVHKSMLAANTERAPTRYTMLETLRIYGRERLEHTGRLEAARRRHAAHFVAVAEASANGLIGPDEASWADRIGGMLDDLRSAHSWALAHEPQTAVRLSAALIRYTSAHGPSEIYNWAERAAAADIPGPALATTLAVAAAGAARRGDLAGATERARHGLAVVAADDPARRYPLWVLARVASFQGRFLAAAELYAAVANIAAGVGDTHCVAYVSASGALQYAYLGDIDEALRLARRADALAEETRNPTARAWVGYALGVALQDRAPEQALAALDTAFTVGCEGHNTYIPGVALNVATGLMTRHGDLHRAALLAARVIDYWSRESHWAQQWVALRTAICLLARVGADEAAAMVYGALVASTAAIQPTGADAELLDEVVTSIEARLGPDQFAAAIAKGRTMSDDDAVAFTKATLGRITRNGFPVPTARDGSGSFCKQI